MLKVYVIFFFFVKAVKEIIIDSLHSASLILGCCCGFGGSLKIKLMELSCLQNFLWLQSLLCVFTRNGFEGKLLFYAPGWSRSCSGSLLHRQSFCCSGEVGSPWAVGSFSCPVWAHLTVCELGWLWWAQLFTPTIIWLFYQHHFYRPISGHEQRELASAHKPCEHT